MRMTVGRRIPVMFKAEYIMSVDDNLCSGCRKCEKLCQFNALNYDFTRKKIVIEKENCFGCGICRSVCEKKALTLSSRR